LLPFGKTTAMNRFTFLLLSCFGASTLFFTACAGEATAAKEIMEEVNIEKIVEGDADPGLMHLVHFWLADGLTVLICASVKSISISEPSIRKPVCSEASPLLSIAYSSRTFAIARLSGREALHWVRSNFIGTRYG